LNLVKKYLRIDWLLERPEGMCVVLLPKGGEEIYPSIIVKSTSPLRHDKINILILARNALNLNSRNTMRFRAEML
jgi:hypothetical protein